MRIKSKYIATEEIENKVREIYNSAYHTGALSDYAKEIGWPVRELSRVAQRIGVTFNREKHWTPEEVRLLAKYAHLSTSTIEKKLIRHGYTRTQAGIKKKLFTEKLRSNVPWFRVLDASRVLGVSESRLNRWLTMGLIDFSYKNDETEAPVKIIHYKDLRRFILVYPSEVNHKKFEWLWICDILSHGGGKWLDTLGFEEELQGRVNHYRDLQADLKIRISAPEFCEYRDNMERNLADLELRIQELLWVLGKKKEFIS